jgi:DnaJ family protein A protein 5
MGAEQSSTRGASDQNKSEPVRKTCYYEVLGIERTATEDE